MSEAMCVTIVCRQRMCKAGVHRKAACTPSTGGLPVLEGSQQTIRACATAACHRIGGLPILKAASSPAAHFNQVRASGKLCANHKGSANECQRHIGLQHARRGLCALSFAHQPNWSLQGANTFDRFGYAKRAPLNLGVRPLNSWRNQDEQI